MEKTPDFYLKIGCFWLIYIFNLAELFLFGLDNSYWESSIHPEVRAYNLSSVALCRFRKKNVVAFMSGWIYMFTYIPYFQPDRF